MAGDLAGHAAALDARRHVPDPALTEVLERLLDPDSSHQALVLHGPGGIGKSAALRQLARLAEARGLRAIALDGRDLAEAPHAIAEHLAGAASDRPDLLLIDEAGALGASGRAVRTAIGALPAHARVVLADRQPVDLRWLPDGLGVLTRRLRPLPDELSREIVHRHGVEEAHVVDAIVGWAAGSPLALVMAAVTGDAFGAGQAPPDLLDALAQRLGGGDLGIDLELLRVASLSWEVHAELLADVLPSRDPEAALADLRNQPVVERLGERAALHPLIARSVADRFRIDDPHRYRTLVLRLAAHLRDRAAGGDATALPPLADLMRDPLLRQGLGLATSSHYYADQVRAADAETIAAWLPPGERYWWPVLTPWLTQGHRYTQVVRDLDGRLSSAIAILPATSAVDDDPLVGPLVGYARSEGLAERCVITAFQLVLPPDQPAELTRFANAVSVLGCGLRNPRFDLVNEIGWTDEMRELTAGYGYQEIPALRRQVGGRELRTWFSDSGEGGLAGMLFDTVAAENGVAPGSYADRSAVLLDALDAYTDDSALTAIAASLGEQDPDSVAFLRHRVRRAVTDALAGRDDLHALVDLRYLKPGNGHAETMKRLFLSRSSYFRMLRQARDLIAAR